jgi:hypothetical protein
VPLRLCARKNKPEAVISPQRRQEIIDALRRGTVPRIGLDVLAVNLERFEETLDSELDQVKAGRAVFKAVRGEYGSGKTFFARWLQERAWRRGFATSEVQISEAETPLHRLETVYRRLAERLSTNDTRNGALRSIIDGWFFALEEDVLAEGKITEGDTQALLARTAELMEQRLAAISRTAPAFAAALRGYRRALAERNNATADSLIAWLAGEPNVAAAAKRYAGIKGDIDHFGALSFLQGLLVMLRDSGHAGLLVVLDEVETLQRVRSDVRERGLNALRQLIDEVDAGRFPGLHLLITGTPAFFDGPQGVARLPPLAQRLQVDFATDARFDNPRAVQIRLPGFQRESLQAVGIKVRDIYASHAGAEDRILAKADDSYVAALADAVTGRLGGKVGVTPRIFLKKLVADVLDRIDQFEDFDPRQHYSLTVNENEMNAAERQAAGAASVDEIEIDA